jgi:hypothetical protein
MNNYYSLLTAHMMQLQGVIIKDIIKDIIPFRILISGFFVRLPRTFKSSADFASGRTTSYEFN